MSSCPHCKARPFVTDYAHNGKRAQYATQAPTTMHATIRASDPTAETLRYDYTVKDWPFGLYAECIVPSANRTAKLKRRTVQ